MALGIFHCVSKFKLIFLIALLALALLCYRSPTTHCLHSLTFSLSLRSQPALSAIVLFICVILIYSPYYSFALLRQCDGSTDVSLCACMCVCVCTPACVCVCVYYGLSAAFAVHFNVFRFFSDLSAIRAICFALFLLLCISNICTHTFIHMSLSVCACVCQRLRRRSSGSAHVSRFHS